MEDFLINRFGRELYLTFFKSYTEKVWGVPCDQISAAWGAQSIKGLSLRKADMHFLKKLFAWKGKGKTDIRQKDSETSLIEQFLYPKYRPGQLWERVAKLVEQQGGESSPGLRVSELHVLQGPAWSGSRYRRSRRRHRDGEIVTLDGRLLLFDDADSRIAAVDGCAGPSEIQTISDGLMYRDFITVGLLVDRLLITEPGWFADQGHLDLHPGARCARRALADLQQLESATWWQIRRRYGLGWSISATTRTRFGTNRMQEIADFAIEEIASIGIVNPTKCAIHAYFACLRLIRPTSGPTTDSTKSSATWSDSRTCSWWDETGCTSTTTRITRCLPR